MIFIVKQTATVIKDGDGGSEWKRWHTVQQNIEFTIAIRIQYMLQYGKLLQMVLGWVNW